MERQIAIIKNKADCLLGTAQLPYKFINFAVDYAVALLNVLYSNTINTTRMEMATPQRKPK